MPADENEGVYSICMHSAERRFIQWDWLVPDD